MQHTLGTTDVNLNGALGAAPLPLRSEASASPRLADEQRTAGPTSLVGMSLAEIEKQAVLETLAACDGNKAQAARLLGVSEKTIYNKLKQYRRNPR